MTILPLHPAPDLTALTDEELTDEITTWAGRLAAGEARLLLLIGELDRRGSWFAPGFLTCAHWLSWRLGLGLTAARERVRVARALQQLPRTTEAMRAGRMSYAQVRAVTRAATAEDEQTWIGLAEHATGNQLEKLARGVRRVRRQREDEADPGRAEYRMRTTMRYDEDGTFSLTWRGKAEDGVVLLAAIEAGQADLKRRRQDELREERRRVRIAQSRSESRPGPDAEAATEGIADGVSAASEDASAEAPPVGDRADEPWIPKPSMADGLLHLAHQAAEHLGAEHPETARRSRSRLTAHVDPLSGWARLRDGELLPPTTLTAVRDSLPGRHQLRPMLPADRTAHDLGRSSRTPTLALREHLGVVDGERCRFPGCAGARSLHAHHVVYWSRGGRTDLDNLVLVCARHHTLIHEHDHQLVLHADRTLTVTTADGTALVHHPSLPWGDPAALDPDQAVTASTLRSGNSEQPLDLGYAVMVLVQHAA